MHYMTVLNVWNDSGSALSARCLALQCNPTSDTSMKNLYIAIWTTIIRLMIAFSRFYGVF